MGQQDRTAALGDDVGHGGGKAAYAGIVGHFAFFDGHVDIDAHQNALAVQFHVIERFPSHAVGSQSAKQSLALWRRLRVQVNAASVFFGDAM